MTAALRIAFSLARLWTAQALRHAAVTVGLWVLAMLALLFGIIGLLAAMWIWLARVLDPLAAALAIGGGGVACSIILLAVVRMRRAAPLLPPTATEKVHAAFADRKTGLDLWGSLLGLAILGFVLGRMGKGDDHPDP